MKTGGLTLLSYHIRSCSLKAIWYKNGQMDSYFKWNRDKRDGAHKMWHPCGQLWLHSIYENGRFVKNML